MSTSAESRRVRPDRVVITDAERSYDEQVKGRRRRYLIMMGMRIPLLVAGFACLHTPWLAITLVVLSVPLPWIAVLIANDRPARKTRRVVPGVINYERALPGPTREIVDSD